MLSTWRLELRDANWLGDGSLADIPADGLPVFAKVRSTRPPAEARLNVSNGVVTVDLNEGETGVAPGQACVFYEDDNPRSRVLGGGFIRRSERAREAERQLQALAGHAGDAHVAG